MHLHTREDEVFLINGWVFRSVGHDVSTRKPQGWAITPATLGAAASAHGQQILGPP